MLLDCNKLPPLAALYQSTALPPGAVALIVAGVALWHTVTVPPLVGAAGFTLTVKDLFAEVVPHEPPLVVRVKVTGEPDEADAV